MLSLLAVAGNGLAQDVLSHFEPVGNTGIHRAVVINSVAIDGFTLTEGDEIAVYDGDLCVGAERVAPNAQSDLTPVAISSILKVTLPNGTKLPGATSGHPIIYRIWDHETNSEFQAYASDYSSGNGTFGQSYTVVYSLTASISLVTIETSPGGIGFILNGESFVTDASGDKVHICNHDAQYTISVDAIATKNETGIRYEFSSWSNGQPISHSFTGPTGNWRLTADFNTQYKLDVLSDFNNVNGTGWYVDGVDVEISIDTSYVPAGVDRQYEFVGWTGIGGVQAYTGSDSAHTVTMDHPMTETANWQKQFYLHTAKTPDQFGTIHPDPPGRWYNEGASAEVFAVGGDGFQLNYFSGVSEAPTGNTILIPMDTSKTVTAHFKKEVNVVVKTSPLNLEYIVDGVMYDVTKSFTWFEGEIHTLGVADTSLIQNEGSGQRSEYKSWSDGGSRVHNFRVSAAEETVTALFDTVYQLTLVTGPGTATGSGWYKRGLSASFSIDAMTTTETDGQRFRFTGWQGTDANAYNGPDAAQSVIMNNPVTQTALWQKQFELKAIEQPDEGGNISLYPPGGWYDEDTRVGVKAVALSGYNWSGWSGDIHSTSDSVGVQMTSPKNAVASFAKVVEVVVQSNPDGREFYVDGIKYSSAQTFTWFKDSTHTLLISDSLQGENNGSRFRYNNWSTGGRINHVFTTPSVNITVTVNFTAQYYLDIKGIPGSALGEGWYDEGTDVQFSINSMNVEKGTCTRYHFTGWQGAGISAYTGPDSAHAVRVTNKITETALWETEFLLNVNSEYGTPEGTGWYTKGATVSITVAPDTVVTDVDERYFFDSWNGEGDGSYTGKDRSKSFTIDTCITETVIWQKQYSLTTRSKPAGTGSITLSPQGLWYGSGATWYNSGDTVKVEAIPGAADPFTEFTGDLGGSTNPQNLIMSEPKEVTANFKDFIHLKIDADHAGVEFRYLLGTDTITVATPHSFSTEAGDEFKLIVEKNQTIGDSIKYVFDRWADGTLTRERAFIVQNTDATLTIKVEAEYKLEIASAHDTPTGTGWYTEGSTAEFAISSPVESKDHARWAFKVWEGDYTGSNLSGSFNMNGPKSLTAVWKKQYELTIGTAYSSFHGNGWYFEGDTAKFGVTEPFYQSDSVRYKLIEWSGSGAGAYSENDTTLIKSDSLVIMNNPIHQLAKWEKQNRLVVNVKPSNGGSVALDPPGGWYRSGLSVLLTPTTSEGFLWGGWGGALTGLEKPKSIVMNFPKTVSANFGTFVPIEIGTSPSKLNYYIDGKKFEKDSTFKLVIGATYWFSTDSPQSIDNQRNIRYFFTDWSSRNDHEQAFKYTPRASESITVNFKKQYQLVVRSDHGEPYPDSSKSASWYDDKIPPGAGKFGITTRTVSKNNNEKYNFVKWTSASSGGYNGADSAHIVSMVVPIIETAKWDTLYKLTARVGREGKGTIKITPEKEWYSRGETVQLVTFLKDSSYKFSGWTGGTSSLNDTLNLIMDQPYNLLAEYDLVTYTVQTKVHFINPDGVVYADSGGVITADPLPKDGKYNKRTNVHFSAVPKNGYKFTGWTGALFGTSNPQDLYVLSDETLTATFMLADQAPPYVSDSYPESGSVNLPVNTGIDLKIVDDVYGVNRITLHVNVGGVSIVSSGVAQANTSISAINKGFLVSYKPAEEFGASKTVTVKISCSDKAIPEIQYLINMSLLIPGLQELLIPMSGQCQCKLCR